MKCGRVYTRRGAVEPGHCGQKVGLGPDSKSDCLFKLNWRTHEIFEMVQHLQSAVTSVSVFFRLPPECKTLGTFSIKFPPVRLCLALGKRNRSK